MKKVKLRKITIKKRSFFIASLFFFILVITTFFKSYGEFVTNVQRNNSGIVDNVVYVNDAESDWYYYMAQNYTYSSNGSLPTTENKNIYNANNLAEINITYLGYDYVNANLVGYVSTTERQDTFVYYKVMPINNNGTANNTNDDYVLVELIDNPYGVRPTNMGFNGWTTSYRGVSIYLDTTRFVRYARVPVTYTNGKPNPIDITFYAKWVEATIASVNDNYEIYSGWFSNTDYTWGNIFDELKSIVDLQMLYIQKDLMTID